MTDQLPMWLATMFGIGLTGPLRGPLTITAIVLAMSLVRGRRLVASAIAVAVSLFGWGAAHVVDGMTAASDAGHIVVDEAAGVAVMLALAMPKNWREAIVLGLAFWALDNLKPWPISWIEGWPGALGIMGDDIAAGVMIAVIYLVVCSLYERVALKRPPRG